MQELWRCFRSRQSNLNISVVGKQDIQRERDETIAKIKSDLALVKERKPHGHMALQEKGCYIATSVYGSYDCSEVWVLRRYRDEKMAKSKIGRFFIRLYYKISPWLIKVFGKFGWFQRFWKWLLDRKVKRLKKKGYADTPYVDKEF